MRPSIILLIALASLFVASPAEARLTNVVTDWLNATQASIAVLGVHNIPASRWYAQTALAIHNAVAAGGAPPQALAGASRLTGGP